MTMKDTILFDVDGTLTDPRQGITTSVQYALRHFGIDVPEPDDLCKFIGPPLRQSFREFYGLNDADTEIAVAKYREYFLDRGIYENRMYDGIDTMLQTLKQQGKTLLIASSKPTGQVQAVLRHFHLQGYFTFISGSKLNGDRSDKKELIRYALENTAAGSIQNCIMVGDRKHDIIGAAGVGMDSAGVLYGYGGREELSKAGATHMVKDVAELAALLCG